MPKTNIYDVIVIGTDLAGLLAAGLLRRRNYRVLVVGQGNLRDHYDVNGASIPALPRELPKRGLAPMLDSILHSLAVEDPVHQLGKDVDSHLQIITPEQRIDLFQDPKALEAELERAVPEQKQVFLQTMQKLSEVNQIFTEIINMRPPIPPAGFRDRSRLRRIERQLPQVDVNPKDWPPLLKILYQATTFVSNLDLASRSNLASGRLMLSLLSGSRIVADLSSRVIRAIEKSGVEVNLSMLAEELLLDGKRVCGFQALRSPTKHQSSVMLASLPLSDAVDLIPIRMRRQREKLSGETLRPLQSIFTSNLLIPQEAMPVGLGNNAIVVRSLEKTLEEENLIRVQCLPHETQKDHIQVYLSCLVPYRKRKLSREYLGPLQRHLTDTASWLFPFFEEHLVSQSSPFWNSRSGDTGHPSPWTLHSTLETIQPPALGIAVHPIKTGLRDLLMCGPGVVPGLGIEGEAFCALQVVDWLVEHRKRTRF